MNALLPSSLLLQTNFGQPYPSPVCPLLQPPFASRRCGASLNSILPPNQPLPIRSRFCPACMPRTSRPHVSGPPMFSCRAPLQVCHLCTLYSLPHARASRLCTPPVVSCRACYAWLCFIHPHLLPVRATHDAMANRAVQSVTECQAGEQAVLCLPANQIRIVVMCTPGRHVVRSQRL